MSDDKTDRILTAAESLFLAHGLRATTMETIARTAGVAKPTLYQRFPDKEAVFRAVVLCILENMRTRFLTALDGPEPASERIARALSAKFSMVHDILTRSPHAAQLMEDNILHAGAEFAALNQWVIERIADELARDGCPDPQWHAELIHACLSGVKEQAPTAADLVEKVRYVTKRLLSS